MGSHVNNRGQVFETDIVLVDEVSVFALGEEYPYKGKVYNLNISQYLHDRSLVYGPRE